MNLQNACALTKLHAFIATDLNTECARFFTSNWSYISDFCIFQIAVGLGLMSSMLAVTIENIRVFAELEQNAQKEN